MANEPTVRMSDTPWSIARVKTDQRFETTMVGTRARNGESNQIARNASGLRGSSRLAARNSKPTEPAAPTTGRSKATAESAIAELVRWPRNKRYRVKIQLHTRPSSLGDPKIVCVIKNFALKSYLKSLDLASVGKLFVWATLAA
jgi:hypothetical protein